jgi:hypothetical protein
MALLSKPEGLATGHFAEFWWLFEFRNDDSAGPIGSHCFFGPQQQEEMVYYCPKCNIVRETGSSDSSKCVSKESRETDRVFNTFLSSWT